MKFGGASSVCQSSTSKFYYVKHFFGGKKDNTYLHMLLWVLQRSSHFLEKFYILQVSLKQRLNKTWAAVRSGSKYLNWCHESFLPVLLVFTLLLLRPWQRLNKKP